MRRLSALLALLTVETAAVVTLALTGAAQRGAGAGAAATNRCLVEELQLTDLALWSEAAYCRHLSAGDRFTPFADHPGAMEHFPAGSLVTPPLPPKTPEAP